MRRRLEQQADRIEAVLASHRIPARVLGGVVTPRLVRFQITTALGVKLNRVAQLSEESALSLGAPSARVTRQGGALVVEVPLAEAQPVRLRRLVGRLPAGSVPAVAAVLGVDAEGTPLLLRLPSPDVTHVLVAGTTGSGKTALVRAMVLSLAHYNRQSAVQLVLVDPKGRGLGPLAGLPHLVRPVAVGVEAGVAALGWLVEEMERRDREGIRRPALVVAVDELADLLMVGRKAAEEALVRLAQRGREAGIHLVCCTQKPSAALVSSALKANFPVRAVGRVASADDARVAAGIAGTGAEKLLGRGDFLLVARGEVIRFQAAYVAEEELGGWTAALQAGVGAKPGLGSPPGPVPVLGGAAWDAGSR
ncbi:MAG: DNA translocase FtsK [Caldilineales bacterium]|nr:DNA translocase FtsK [Caldilineales bacterium]